MKTYHVFAAFILIMLLLTGLISCEKEGIGGKGEIRGYAYYEDKPLKTAVFYIKYGADASPGTDISKYDASSTSDSDGEFCFKQLNKGDYYIYTVGTDGDQIVVGGIYIVLGKNEKKENIQINVAP